MTAKKSAILIGATGLVGSHLLKQLLDDERYTKVKVFTRRNTGISHPKLDQHIVDFDEMDMWENRLTGDQLFCCLGTTLKKAGGKESQWRVDYSYQFETAKKASKNGVKSLAICSSASANPHSRMFYLKMKGELDRDVQKLPFEKIRIIKPSTLEGPRTEKRAGEKIYIPLTKFVTALPFLRKYKAIHADIVAKAMINSLVQDIQERVKTYEFLEVFDLANAK